MWRVARSIVLFYFFSSIGAAAAATAISNREITRKRDAAAIAGGAIDGQIKADL